jgi:hypothetical protein
LQEGGLAFDAGDAGVVVVMGQQLSVIGFSALVIQHLEQVSRASTAGSSRRRRNET